MNRKGQIGKLIAILPILFLIFIIMAIFILLAAAGSISSAKNVFHTEAVSQSYLLDRNMVLYGQDMTVRQALSNVTDKNVTDRQIWLVALDKRLKEFLMADADARGAKVEMCLIIFAKIGRGNFVDSATALPLWTKIDGTGFFNFYIRRSLDSNGKGELVPDAYNLGKTGDSSAYSGSMRTFSLITGENNELNGRYYYGACLE